MHTLLWEGSRTETYARNNPKTLHVVDVEKDVSRHYIEKLGGYYDVKDCFAGGSGAFDMFVDEYIRGA